jgi:hypothetical protein
MRLRRTYAFGGNSMNGPSLDLTQSTLEGSDIVYMLGLLTDKTQQMSQRVYQTLSEQIANKQELGVELEVLQELYTMVQLFVVTMNGIDTDEETGFMAKLQHAAKVSPEKAEELGGADAVAASLVENITGLWNQMRRLLVILDMHREVYDNWFSGVIKKLRVEEQEPPSPPVVRFSKDGRFFDQNSKDKGDSNGDQ